MERRLISPVAAFRRRRHTVMAIFFRVSSATVAPGMSVLSIDVKPLTAVAADSNLRPWNITGSLINHKLYLKDANGASLEYKDRGCVRCAPCSTLSVFKGMGKVWVYLCYLRCINFGTYCVFF